MMGKDSRRRHPEAGDGDRRRLCQQESGRRRTSCRTSSAMSTPPWAASMARETRALPRAPAVPVKKSVQDDYIVCLEDGKKLKMLKRYLRARYKMTPDEYRARWNLPPDYPMVAPNYAQKRSDFAKKIGLGKGEGRKGRKKK